MVNREEIYERVESEMSFEIKFKYFMIGIIVIKLLDLAVKAF